MPELGASHRLYNIYLFIMKSPNMRSALSISLLLASGLPAIVKASSVSKGCYSSAPLNYQTQYTFQSTGWCQDHCKERGNEVFALLNGGTCLCGDTLPSDSDKVSDDECNVSCDGYPQDKCKFSWPSIYFSRLMVGQVVERMHTASTSSIRPIILQ